MAIKDKDDGLEFVRGLLKGIGSEAWRNKTREDKETARWSHLFDIVEPSPHVMQLTSMLFHAADGRVNAEYIYTMVLAAYTYGMADAFSKLADEEITLWDGKPIPGFEALWDKEPPKQDPPDGACIGCLVGEVTNPAHHKAGCEFHKTGQLPNVRKPEEDKKE